MAALFTTVIMTSPALAGPLPKERCNALQSLYISLKKTKQVQQMSKGFEWVKANIKGDQLITIKNFIETEEQLKFRCPKVRWINATPVFVGDVPKNRIPPLPQRKNPADEEAYAPAIPPTPKRKEASSQPGKNPAPIKAAALPKPTEKSGYKPKTTPKNKHTAKKPAPAKKAEQPGFFDEFFAVTGSVNKNTQKSSGKAAQKPAPQQTQWPFFLD